MAPLCKCKFIVRRSVANKAFLEIHGKKGAMLTFGSVYFPLFREGWNIVCRWGGCLAAMCVNIFTPFSAAEGAAIALLQSYGELCCCAALLCKGFPCS